MYIHCLQLGIRELMKKQNNEKRGPLRPQRTLKMKKEKRQKKKKKKTKRKKQKKKKQKKKTAIACSCTQRRPPQSSTDSRASFCLSKYPAFLKP